MIAEYKIVDKPFPYAEGEKNQDVPPGIMWVLKRDGKAEMVNFICPCGCGRCCPLPVTESQKREHHWLFSIGPNGGPTLADSVKWLSGCLAHFNIADGKVTLHAN